MNIMLTKTLKILALSSILTLQQVFAATCNDDIPNLTPNTRYTVHNDGTVTDNETRLMWKVCSQGQTWDSRNGGVCLDDLSSSTWAKALEAARDENYAGYDDWYLPNVKELITIVAYNCINPSINDDIFLETQSNYWSSSPKGEDLAWTINFSNGNRGEIDRAGVALSRLVRNTQR